MQVSESLGRDLMRLVVWYPLRLFLERLSPRRGFSALAWFGRLQSRVSRSRRARLQTAVARVSPQLAPAQRAAQVQAAFAIHFANQLCLFLFPRLTRERCASVLEIDGLDHLDAARAAGRGVVLPIGHFGPTQLPLTVLGRLGYPMLQIGYLSDAGLSVIGRRVAFRLRQRYEARIPARIVPPGPGTRLAVAHLRAGGVVMTTADDGPGQPSFGHHGVFDFPGGPLSAPLGPARLALSTGAAFCPVFLGPGKKAPFALTIAAPLAPPVGLEKNAAACAMTGRFLAAYAKRVVARPGWWHSLEAHGFPPPHPERMGS